MSDDSKNTRITFVRSDEAPLRDKDNAKPDLKPEFANRPQPNLAPPGMSGIKSGLGAKSVDHQPTEDMRFLPEFEQAGLAHDHGIEVDGNTHTEGRILTMPGYSFAARVTDDPTEKGIDGGKIDQLILKKDNEIVAQYDQGWDKEAATPEQREAIHRIRNGLDDTDRKQFQRFDHGKDKDHGHEL